MCHSKLKNVIVSHCYLTVLRPYVAVSACLDVVHTALYDGRGVHPREGHAHLPRFVPVKVILTHLPGHILSSITRRWPNWILRMHKTQ